MSHEYERAELLPGVWFVRDAAVRLMAAESRPLAEISAQQLMDAIDADLAQLKPGPTESLGGEA